jgi:hypothetical protein
VLAMLRWQRQAQAKDFSWSVLPEWRGPHQDRRSFGLQRHREAAAHLGFPIEHTSHRLG